MTRRSSEEVSQLSIRRRFDPARTQGYVLAFAFEQALPRVRRPVLRTPTPLGGKNREFPDNSYLMISGASR